MEQLFITFVHLTLFICVSRNFGASTVAKKPTRMTVIPITITVRTFNVVRRRNQVRKRTSSLTLPALSIESDPRHLWTVTVTSEWHGVDLCVGEGLTLVWLLWRHRGGFPTWLRIKQLTGNFPTILFLGTLHDFNFYCCTQGSSVLYDSRCHQLRQ